MISELIPPSLSVGICRLDWIYNWYKIVDKIAPKCLLDHEQKMWGLQWIERN